MSVISRVAAAGAVVSTGSGCRRGYRIVPAGMKGLAAQQTPQGQPAAAQGAMLAERVDRVVRAAGVETAARPEDRADQHLIDADQADEGGTDGAAGKGGEDAAMRVHRRSRF